MSGVLVDRDLLLTVVSFLTFRHYCSFCGVPTKDVDLPDQQHKEGCPAIGIRAALALPAQAAADAAGVRENRWLPGEGKPGIYADDNCEGGMLRVFADEQGDVYFSMWNTAGEHPIVDVRMVAHVQRRPHVFKAARALADALEVQEPQRGVNVAELHRLAVEATATDSTSSAVRHARDELVRVCLSLGGES